MKVKLDDLPTWLKVLVSKNGLLPELQAKALDARHEERKSMLRSLASHRTMNAKEIDAATKLRDARAAAMKKAEAEWHASIRQLREAESQLHGLVSPRDHACSDLEKRIRQLADPRIYDVQRWLYWRVMEPVRQYGLRTWWETRQTLSGPRQEWRSNGDEVQAVHTQLEGIHEDLAAKMLSDYDQDGIHLMLTETVEHVLQLAMKVLPELYMMEAKGTMPNLEVLNPEALLVGESD